MSTRNTVTPTGTIIMVIVVISATLISEAYTTGNNDLYWVLFLFLPVLLFAIIRTRREKTKSSKNVSITRKAA